MDVYRESRDFMAQIRKKYGIEDGRPVFQSEEDTLEWL